MHARRRPSQTREGAFGSAPLRRPGAVGGAETAGMSRRSPARGTVAAASAHPLVRQRDNAHLYAYEQDVKSAFDRIVPTLKRIAGLQHEPGFEDAAQKIARTELGFELPVGVLGEAWVDRLDMRRLFAYCVFATYRRFSDGFFTRDPLSREDDEDFAAFLQGCGFHLMDVSPCADGRLAHIVRFVLRLPFREVRRKSYAGAMFDIEDSVQKWIETEMLRFRESKPNAAGDPTRYLKVVAYHFSSVEPHHEGCAAHGSDTGRAAASGFARLVGFQQAIQNSFCCGASIDLLLIGIDTDTDALRVHVPDAGGAIDLSRHIDATELFERTRRLDETAARRELRDAIAACSPGVQDGMARLIGRLIENNLSQIAYVRSYHGDHYADIGHAERFIGAGVGFEDIQLRNLMYFAYLNTVEEATADIDVGVKIFTGLNVSRGLPVPIVVRFDYHGQVPGARERAVERCRRVSDALQKRFGALSEKGLLHVMQLVRDCRANACVEVLACTASGQSAAGEH